MKVLQDLISSSLKSAQVSLVIGRSHFHARSGTDATWKNRSGYLPTGVNARCMRSSG